MSTRDHRRSARSVDGWGQKSSEPPREWTLRLVDIGFAFLILLLPFVWGGRQALGHFAVVLMSGWTAFWWAVHELRSERPGWRFSGAEPLFLLAVALVALQTIALPESLKDQLSPHIDSLLAGWSDDPETSLGVGHWSSLSFAPWQTWSDLVTLVSVMVVFFVAVQRLQTASEVHRILRWVAISGCLTGSFGIAQYLLGNGQFYWFYTHPDTTTESAAKAAFTNANHFADFLAMSLPAQLWWSVTTFTRLAKLREARNMNRPPPEGWRGLLIEWTPITMLGVTLCALALSQSRGGLLAGAVGLSVIGLSFWRQKLLDSRTGLSLILMGCAATGCLFLFGKGLEQELTSNIEALSSGTTEEIDRSGSRQKIWSTDWKVVQDFPATGTGLGSHRYVYKSYYEYPSDGTEYTHAENGYLQVAMETGVTGFVIVVLAIGLTLSWCLRSLLRDASTDVRAPAAVALAVLAVNLTHSMTDFIWYVPSCMVIVVLFAASAFALYRLSTPVVDREDSSGVQWGRLSWGLSLALLIAGWGWGIRIKWPEVAAEPHYFEYKRLANAEHEGQESTRYEIAAILRAAAANPHDPEIQSRAARAWTRLFLVHHQQDHDLSLDEIRQAAISSDYPTRKDLYAWLDHPDVMGKSRQYLHRSQAAAIEAIRLCPLDYRPYVELSRHGWLTLMSAKRENTLMRQALRGRPHEGRVHLEVARFLLNRGDQQLAEVHYRKAYYQDERCRLALIADLSPHVPARFFLERFDPDRKFLAELRSAYRSQEDVEGYRAILKRLATEELRAADRSIGEIAASHIVTAHGCYAELGDEELSLNVLQKALKRYNTSYNLRSNLANTLFDRGRYAEALPHLEWCHRRQPDNESIARRIEMSIERQDQTEMAAEPSDRELLR